MVQNARMHACTHTSDTHTLDLWCTHTSQTHTLCDRSDVSSELCYSTNRDPRVVRVGAGCGSECKHTSQTHTHTLTNNRSLISVKSAVNSEANNARPGSHWVTRSHFCVHIKKSTLGSLHFDADVRRMTPTSPNAKAVCGCIRHSVHWREASV